MPYTGIGTEKPVSSQVVVLYHPASGEIVHTHQAFFFSSRGTPQERESSLNDLVTKAAREINPNFDTKAYQILHVPDFELGQAEYKVDVAQKKLIEVTSTKNI